MTLRTLKYLLILLFPVGTFTLALFGEAAVAFEPPNALWIHMGIIFAGLILHFILMSRFYRCPHCGRTLSGQWAMPISPKHCPDCGCEIDYDKKISFRKNK